MHQPRRRKDPVLKTFVVIAVLRIRSQHAIVNRARQAGPGGRFGSLVVKRISSDTQACDGDKSVILAISESLAGLRFEIVSHQTRLSDQLVAIPRALFFSEVVIEQIITPAQTVEQMTRGQIYVRLIAGVTPDVVTDGRVHVFLRRFEIFLVAIDLVDERTFDDRDADIILLAALFRGCWWWLGSKSTHVVDRSLPKLTMRSASAFAQFSELFVRNVNTRMNAHQLGPQSRLARSHQ